MPRRRRLPPDTRPKWDDPNLPGYLGWDSASLEADCQRRLEQYDRKPRDIRDRWKYSLYNDPNSPPDDMPH